MTGRLLVSASFAVAALLAVLGPVEPLLLWNASASAPTGLYRLTRAGALRRGDRVVVTLAPPLSEWMVERGYVPTSVPLIKPVAALAGQRVCRFGSAVTIDGQLAGLARTRDSQGRILPYWLGCRQLGADEIFLMNPAVGDSLDGRYFGPVPRAAVRYLALPLWTDETCEGGRTRFAGCADPASIPTNGDLP